MRKLLMMLAIAASALVGQAARAQDGCAVALCLAGEWDKLPQSTACVPPVRAALRRAALGHSWPTCHTSSGHVEIPGGPSSSGGSMDAVETPTNMGNCPPWYTVWDRYGEYHGCTFKGIISVQVDGAPWTDVFWNAGGGTVTHYYPAAVTALHGEVNPQYADDEKNFVPPKHTGPER